jgi:oxygen-dependent protoporphyrinogen oxidase
VSVDVVVVGGGIAGLAATDRLAAAGLDVTLLEATDRLGGKVHTTAFAGRPLDLGAEVLVTRDPTAIELCRDLSLDGDLVSPAVEGAYVWTRGRLRALPADPLTRLPGDAGDLLRSRLLSPRGAIRCGLDLVRPSQAPDDDVAIGAIIRERLGAQVLDRLVDPLLGGIHAGRCDQLSAQALAPQLLAALATGKGLVRGLRATTHSGGGAAFVTLRGGLETLTRALSARLEAAGVVVRLSSPAGAVDAAGQNRLTIRSATGEELQAAACVIAAPARPAGAMLARTAPAAAWELDGIAYAAAAVVALAYPSAALAGLPVGTGFVTAGEGQLVRACTWASAKWQHLDGDPAIVKAFVGRAGSPPPDVGDGELVALVHRELTRALSLRHAPVDARVRRFGAAIPQYEVGHLDRVARIDAALPGNIAVAGAAYRGAGLAACVRSGRAGAERVMRHLGVATDSSTSEIARSQV